MIGWGCALWLLIVDFRDGLVSGLPPPAWVKNTTQEIQSGFSLTNACDIDRTFPRNRHLGLRRTVTMLSLPDIIPGAVRGVRSVLSGIPTVP